MNKYRYHQIRIIIMIHMDSKPVFQMDSMLSVSAYFDVLKRISLSKDLLIRVITTNKETWQQGTPHYTVGKNGPT